MKKMNKSYILTALGVLGSPLLTTSANADLFKCVACDNKPANSYYTSSGNGTSNCSWSCIGGFTKKGNTCCENPPPNATFINDNDCRWACNSGYTVNGFMCCPNKPSNSSYNSGSCNWSCNRGYTKNGNLCCPNRPSDSSYNIGSCDWTCNSGYTKNGNLCCIGKPAANSSYNSGSCDWSCDSGTVKNNNLCCKVSGGNYTFESSNSCNIKCDVGYSSNGSGGATSGAISKCYKDYFMVEVAGRLCDKRINVTQERISTSGGSLGMVYCNPKTLQGGIPFLAYEITKFNSVSGNIYRTLSWTYNNRTYSKTIYAGSGCFVCASGENSKGDSQTPIQGCSNSEHLSSLNDYFVICNDKLLHLDKNKNFIGEL